MNEPLTKVCEQFIADRDIIKTTFPWDSTYIVPVCAMAFGSRNKAVSADKLKECRKLLEQHTSIFSNFRGNTKLPTMTILAAADDPAESLQNAMAIYATMKEHFYGTQYLAYISAVLTEMISRDRAEEVAVHAKTIYNKMKQDHPFLTSGEDSVFAVLLSFSDKSDDALIEEMETCYKTLKPHFFDSNAVQSVTHVLTLADGSAKEKCDRFLAIFDGLKQAGRKYGKTYDLAVLAILSLLDTDVDTLIAEIAQADDFLETQKGYGIFSINRQTRLMHAAMLVSIFHGADAVDTAAMTSTLAMVAAQQAAMCAVIASTTVATAAN